ncbi:MAG: hypothetical protein R3C01_04235 [Planctomycetaceae bacterium]
MESGPLVGDAKGLFITLMWSFVARRGILGLAMLYASFTGESREHSCVGVRTEEVTASRK